MMLAQALLVLAITTRGYRTAYDIHSLMPYTRGAAGLSFLLSCACFPEDHAQAGPPIWPAKFGSGPNL